MREALDKGRATRHETLKKRAAIRAENPEAKSRHQQLLDGELDVKDLDDEELKHGRGRDIDGELKGRMAPIPVKIVQALHAEIFRRHASMMRSALVDATATLIELANNPDVKDEVRIKAANIVIERNAGKIPQEVRVGSADPWDDILNEIMEESSDVAAKRARERLSKMVQKEVDQ
jgi:hypothetical protein